MQLELTEQEAKLLHKILEHALSSMREEIVHTERHEWKVALHREEELLKAIIGKLG